MSLSNWEHKEILECSKCVYSDKAKLKEMKEAHDREDWLTCGNISSCLYPFKLHIFKNKNGKYVCKQHKEER